MLPQFSTWEFLAGLGIFLLGMLMIEGALSKLAGRSFKRFLRRFTDRPIKAILGGTAVTAVLQSSSVVSLMVLAFVGAGIIELQNAIGIILGSNLGTTMTGWVVAYFGFQFDIEKFALPFIAIGGLGMVFFSNKEKLNEFAKLLVGMGFIFLGLEYMKSSMELLATTFDLSPYVAYGPYFLFVVGFVLTAIIQSSSASMVITLSALNAGIIPLESAAAMVIGSDLGTTITTIFGGLGGTASKKRVALSHFLFNLITDLLALALLFPILRLITEVLNITNPLLSLVAFHSTFNLLGIIIFLPFLKIFARFLNKRFTKGELHVTTFINNVPVEVPEVAIEALRKEVRHLISRIFYLHLNILDINNAPFQIGGKKDHYSSDDSIIEQYAVVKELEGELVAFYVKVQNQQLDSDTSVKLKQLILAIRYAMTAAKSMKDINHNMEVFNRSVNDEQLKLTGTLKIQQEVLYLELFRIFESKSPELFFEDLSNLKSKSKKHYNLFLDMAYQSVHQNKLSDIEISTLFNVNREVHNANKSLILAIKEVTLDDIRATDFDTISEIT